MKTSLYRQVLLGLSLAACATDDSFVAYGYKWVPDPTRPDCPSVQWEKVDTSVVQWFCPARPGNVTVSCALAGSCTVLSIFTEAEAKNVDAYGISNYAHEVEWHIHKKLAHPF